MSTNMTHLAPSPWRGFCLGGLCPLRWLPADARRTAHGWGSGYYNRVIMKTLIGALTVGTILDGVSALAADAQHLRQPKHDAPERLRMIRECMGMHHKHGGDMPFHSGGNERLYRACMATRPPWIKTRKLARDWLIARARASHVRATRTRSVQLVLAIAALPAPPGLRAGAGFDLSSSFPNFARIPRVRSGRLTRRRATNRLAEPEPGRRRRGSMSSRVRPDGAAALLAGGPVRARRARGDVDCRQFVDKGQFTADVRAVVVTVRGILNHFAQQGASGHGMVFAQNRYHAS